MRKADRDQSRLLANSAQSLMQLASSLLGPGSPRLVAIGGGIEADRILISDDLAPRFAPVPGARVVRSGRQTTAQANATITGEAAEIITAGYTAILDAPFEDSMRLRQVAELVEAKHVPFVGLWLGDARNAPSAWHVVDHDHGTAAVMTAARRLSGAAALPREPGNP